MRTVLVTTIILFTYCQTLAQDTLSLQEQWALLEAELDSFAIFSSIDSLLNLETKAPSEFNIRFGYNSNIASAGRNYGIDQHGLAPGFTYYDKTGLWADVSGYWNSETDPNYSLTVISGGYLNYFTPKWTYGVSYERWQFNGGESFFENSINASTAYTLEPLTAGLDYSFLFGSETANRFIGSISGNIKIGKWWKIDLISLNPTASAILGNDIITTFTVSSNERATNLFQLIQLSEGELDLVLANAVRNGRITREEATATRRRINNLTNDQLDRLIEAVFLEENDKVFGLLNYNFSLPISFSTKSLLIFLAYTYSIPVELPDEDFTLDPIGYFSVSFNYRLPIN